MSLLHSSSFHVVISLLSVLLLLETWSSSSCMIIMIMMLGGTGVYGKIEERHVCWSGSPKKLCKTFPLFSRRNRNKWKEYSKREKIPRNWWKRVIFSARASFLTENDPEKISMKWTQGNGNGNSQNGWHQEEDLASMSSSGISIFFIPCLLRQIHLDKECPVFDHVLLSFSV